MEFDNIGSQCFVCKQRDFLPFKCEHCHNLYCLDHRTPDSHKCPVNTPVPLPKASNKLPLYKCSVTDCRTKQSFQNICTRCGNHHCLRHRYPEEHTCQIDSVSIPNKNTITSNIVVKPRKHLVNQTRRQRKSCRSRIIKLWDKISFKK